MSIIDVSSGYHNLKLDTEWSYLTMFSCPFGRYHYKCLPFGAALVGNMFQRKIDEIFNDIPNVFGIADDILVIGLTSFIGISPSKQWAGQSLYQIHKMHV